MGIRWTKDAVYDLKYHLVWIPKYRKRVLEKEVSDYLREVFRQIAEEYEFGIDKLEVIVEYRTGHLGADKTTIAPSLDKACHIAGVKSVSESTVVRIMA